MSDATPVASSATPDPEPTILSPAEQAVADGDVSRFREIRRAERAGTEPTKADSAPATPVDQAGERPEPSPASEPGRPGHKGNAETRKAELQAEIDGLLRQRATLRRELTTPAPLPESRPAVSQPKADADAEPTLSQFEADPEQYPDPYAAFVDARARWAYRQEHARLEAETRERTERARDDAAEAEVVGTFARRLDEAVKADPAFLTSLSDDVRNFQTVKQAHAANEARAAAGQPLIRLTPRHAIASEIVESPHAVEVMRHLSAHPEDLAALEQSPNPRALLRAFGALEARVRAGTPEATPARVITSAPPPPARIGTPTSEPVDEADAAVRNHDVAAFRAARQRERLRTAQR